MNINTILQSLIWLLNVGAKQSHTTRLRYMESSIFLQLKTALKIFKKINEGSKALYYSCADVEVI